MADIATGRQLRINIDRATKDELRAELRRVAPVYREACTLADLSDRDNGRSPSVTEQRDRLAVSIASARGKDLGLKPDQLAYLSRPLDGDPPADTSNGAS